MPLPKELCTLFGDALRACLREGVPVELDGLGLFQKNGERTEFLPARGPKVFLAYVKEDSTQVLRLYDALLEAGMNPWLDRKKLLPGQNWRRCIDRAIDTADFFIACYSKTAVLKRGQFPYEVRYGLRCAERMPLDDVYFVPVRLEECDVPQRIMCQIQYLDLFPDAEEGQQTLVRSLRREWHSRQSRRAA